MSNSPPPTLPASYLSSLPKDSEELLSTCTSSHDPVALNSPRTPPLSIVFYVLCNNLLRTANSAPVSSSTAGGVWLESPVTSTHSVSQEEKMECLNIIRAFSELLNSEDVPAFLRERTVLQVSSRRGNAEVHVPSSSTLTLQYFDKFVNRVPQAWFFRGGALNLVTLPLLENAKLTTKVQNPCPPIIFPAFNCLKETLTRIYRVAVAHCQSYAPFQHLTFLSIRVSAEVCSLTVFSHIHSRCS